jgi:hypothetical protein
MNLSSADNENTSSANNNSSSSKSTELSIFGSNSLMAYDESTGSWELTAEPARFRHNTSGRWAGSSSRGSFTGSASFHGVTSYGSRRSATGSKGAAPDAAGVSSLRVSSITGRTMHGSSTGAVPTGIAGAGDAAVGSNAEEDLLSQPQQVTQGQQQVLLFAGLFLARRQQFPLLVQVGGTAAVLLLCL